MSRHRSTFRSAALCASLLAASIALTPRSARAQACCAGSGAITPGRLGMHDRVLVGALARTSTVLGNYDRDGTYVPARGSTELDFEQDVFGGVRVLSRGQIAALVPIVETRRHLRGQSELGGGLGDVNFAARYDFYLAGQSLYLPGVALLAGVTLPTGTPPDKASKPLASDATGIGAFQGNLGLALEQSYGPWLFNVTGLLAKRTSRSVHGIDSTLGTQLTGLAAVAYNLDDGSAVALVGTYTAEGDATVDGASAPDSGRRSFRLSLSGLWAIDDRIRLQNSLLLDPPLGGFGRSNPVAAGFTLGLIASWS